MCFILEDPELKGFFIYCRQGLNSHTLWFKGELVFKIPVDNDRQFVISYYLSDDTISLYENALHNSGNKIYVGVFYFP